MKCPICNGKTTLIDTRLPKGTVGTIHRQYECSKCFTEFKTSEKVLFGSLPPYIRERFIMEGRRGE